MAVVRWGRLAADVPVGAPKVRWGRLSTDGTASTAPKVRWGRAVVDGTAAVVINPIADVTSEPEANVTISATLSSGSADSWSWRRISGPAITLIGSGATRSFRAPSGMPPDGVTVVLGVTATIGSVISAERIVTITVIPQWAWRFSGGAWVGRRATVHL